MSFWGVDLEPLGPVGEEGVGLFEGLFGQGQSPTGALRSRETSRAAGFGGHCVPGNDSDPEGQM